MTDTANLNGHDNELLTTFCRNFKQLCLERAAWRTHNIRLKEITLVHPHTVA
jgi:hypothetical protein